MNFLNNDIPLSCHAQSDSLPYRFLEIFPALSLSAVAGLCIGMSIKSKLDYCYKVCAAVADVDFSLTSDSNNVI